MKVIAFCIILGGLFVLSPGDVHAQNGTPPRHIDRFEHKARDFENTDPLDQVPSEVERVAPTSAQIRQAGFDSQRAAPKFVIQEPAEQTTPSAGSGPIRFFNNETLISQQRGPIPAGTSVKIVNGSAVTSPVLHSRKTMVRTK